MKIFFLTFALICLILSGNTLAKKPLPHIYKADVLSVYDGDSIKVSLELMPDLFFSRSIRINGIDTPEIRGKCSKEKRLAKKSKDLTTVLAGQQVILKNVFEGKFAGRLVGDVYTLNNEKIADILINHKLARSYDGKSKRQSWCD